MNLKMINILFVIIVLLETSCVESADIKKINNELINQSNLDVNSQTQTDTQLITQTGTVSIIQSDTNITVESNTSTQTEDDGAQIILPALPTIPVIPTLPVILDETDPVTQTNTDITQLPISISENCQSSQYVAGIKYNNLDVVFNKQAAYSCKISGWCSSTAGFAYEPGVGFGWTEAWERVEFCTLSEIDTDTDTDTNDQTQSNNSTNTTTQTQVETMPANPSGLLTVFINNFIQISFVDNSNNEIGFEIYRSINSEPYELLTTLNENEFLYNDASYSNAQSIIYIVRAKNTLFYSEFTAPSIITIEQPKIEPPIIENPIEQPINPVLKTTYENKCTACHKPQGFGGDLEYPSIKAGLINNGFERLLAKTKTMSVSNCDDECFNNSAKYVWLVLFEQELSDKTLNETSIISQGVRGLRLLTPAEYKNSIRDILNVVVSDSALPKRVVTHEFKFDTDSDSGVMNYENVNNYLQVAQSISNNFDFSNTPYNTNTKNNYLAIAEKVYRRVLTISEFDILTNIYNQSSINDAITVLLISPNFLYRYELGQFDNDKNAYKLTNFEVAAALSYQLWGNTHNDWLMNLAKNNQLSTTIQIRAAAQIMIEDNQFVDNFVNFLKFYTKSYDELFEKPNLSQAVIDAMLLERQYATAYLFEQGSANIDELFNPNYTFVNNVLADHYQINSSSNDMIKVIVDRNRGGLLHQGLTQISNSDFLSTSLVKRGKMIRENMMCHTMGVPSGVDPSEIELPEVAITTAQRWDIITGADASQGQCWKCHQLMNEPGNALESFDAAGQYRTQEQAYNQQAVLIDIQTSGTLRDNTGFTNLDNYQDTRDLTQYLANDAELRACFVDNLYRFGFGQNVDSSVKESVDLVANQFIESGNIKQLILNLVSSEHFLYRTDRN
ncbi:MAG: DUF1588 domain-containing protein [Saccharospirillaceae bacterium]|nr:DUF1588 domain-containing protein [Pseudomonadales bacterium]NRB80159.1 DUF1588 domain-containing protein [Saccharospirillaceae bacterium]